MRTSMRSLVPALLVALAVPAVGEAQSIGDRLKKKVGLGGGEQQQEATAASASTFNGDEITPEVLEHFTNGLKTEIALRAEFAALLATYKTPEEYQQCSNGVATSPEGMKIMERMLNVPENPTPEQMQRIYAEGDVALRELLGKVCGPDPQDWTLQKRQEKLAEIEKKAADAAGPATDSSPSPEHGPSVAADDAFALQGMPLLVYQMIKERVIAYCMALESGAIQPGQAVQFPGTGANIYWVFTAAEAQAIAPMCAQLMPMLQSVQ